MLWFAIVVIVLIILSSAIKIVQEYERGVIFRLGRCVGARGPGLIILIPCVERMQKVDLRVITMDIPTQEVITKDNVTVKVNAVVYFRVVNPVDVGNQGARPHQGNHAVVPDHAAQRTRPV